MTGSVTSAAPGLCQTAAESSSQGTIKAPQAPPLSSRLYLTTTGPSDAASASGPQRLRITLRGSATVPSAAVKSRTPAAVDTPDEEVISKKMAPFLDASCVMSISPTDLGSSTCAGMQVARLR